MRRYTGMSESSIAAALLVENSSRCDPPLLDDEVRKIAASVARYESSGVDGPASLQADCGALHDVDAEPLPWFPPLPLDMPKLPAFPTDVLPSILRDFVVALALATQTPPDLAGMLTITAIATATARKAIVQVRTGYIEPLNIYVAGVLGSGNRKSAVFRAVTAPLATWERDERIRLAPEIAEARSRRKIKEQGLHKAEKEAAESKEAAERTAATERASALARELATLADLVEPQLIADDATPETVKTLLAEQGGRLALLSDEGTVFELMGGRYSKHGGPNLEVYLHGHSGDAIRVNRRGRRETIESPALTIGVTIQPDVLRAFADHPAFRGRGMVARFIYVLPESYVGRRDTDPPPVPDRVFDGYAAVVMALLALPNPEFPYQLTLDTYAGARFRSFQREIEPQLAEFGRLGDMADWGSKLPGAVARLAGLLHLACHAHDQRPWDEPIVLSTLEAAIAIGEYAIPHALAAAGAMGLDGADNDARYLLRWLRGRTEAQLAEQVIWQATKRHFQNAERLRAALAVLVDHGYLRALPVRRAVSGKTRRPDYAVNPALHPNAPNTPEGASEDHPDAANRGIRGIRPEIQDSEVIVARGTDDGTFVVSTEDEFGLDDSEWGRL